MGDHFSDCQIVIKSVLGSLHPRYELAQRIVPVLSHELLIRKEIIDDRPYAEGRKHAVFSWRILHVIVGLISEGGCPLSQPRPGRRRKLTRLCELNSRLQRWVLLAFLA